MPPTEPRPEPDELAYIKYSAKELLFHQGMKIEALTNELSAMKIAFAKDLLEIKRDMVSRAEMTTTRRWAIGSLTGAGALLVATLRFLGI